MTLGHSSNLNSALSTHTRKYPNLRTPWGFKFESHEPNECYFLLSADQTWICFNTGLQNSFGAVFQRYKAQPGGHISPDMRPDWVYKGCHPSNDRQYRSIFGTRSPKIAWYSKDSRDYIFNTSYVLDKEAFDLMRNYKIAIPVYYVEEKRMQLLLPFVSASDSNDVSCFLVEREDGNCCYRLKTIFDLDQAYFSARLITRPDKDWLNP
jgi:hypothetical protein